MRHPRFNDEHLKAIHRALISLPWQEERYYEERHEVIALLDKYFGDERKHLQDEINPRKEEQMP